MKPRMSRTSALVVLLLAVDALVLNGRAAAQEVDPAELVRDIHAIFGEHHARAVHAKGVVLEASFEPTEQARRLSTASVFAGNLKATVRLSNTTGIPTIPDADPFASPHGLAVKFALADGSEMDLVTHSFNGFPAPNGDRVRRLPQGGRRERAGNGKAHADRAVPAGPSQGPAFRHTAESAA